MNSATMRMMGRRLVPDDFDVAARIMCAFTAGILPVDCAAAGQPIRALGLREADTRARRLS
jgi:hypothetical protein